jgi:hypothetical protein
MQQYMLLIVTDPKAPPLPEAELNQLLGAYMKVTEDLTAQKKLVHSSRLRPPSEAKTVRFVGGKKLVVDGPFSETKEAVGGYYVIECESQAEAIEWAKRLPASCVEVQALWPV